LPGDAKANDLVFWNTQLLVDDLPALENQLRAAGTRFVSQADGKSRAEVIRDPDGHAFTIQGVLHPAFSAATK
jgi:hypothetical protein